MFLRFFNWLLGLLGLKKYLFKCGHWGKLKTHMTIFGKTGCYEIPEGEVGEHVCVDCFKKMVIRCPWCGGPIFPGDEVTSGPLPSGINLHRSIVVINRQEMGRRAIGCNNWHCGKNGRVRAGKWVRPGMVEEVIEPLNLCWG